MQKNWKNGRSVAEFNAYMYEMFDYMYEFVLHRRTVTCKSSLGNIHFVNAFMQTQRLWKQTKER